MPFFEGASGTITMNNCPITDVKGDMHTTDNSRHVNNHDSNNKTTHSTTNSHNDSSTVEEGDQNTYNTFKDGRRVISGMVHTTVRGNNQSSPLATGVPHTFPRRADRNAARPTERARQQTLEGRAHEHWAPRRENGSERLLRERQSRNAEYPWAENYDPAARRQNLEERESYEYQRRPAPARRPEERHMHSGAEHPWQGNNYYEPTERMRRQDSDEDDLSESEYYRDPPAPTRHVGGRRPMRGPVGQTRKENYDMDVDDYPEEAPSPPTFPSPGRPSLNPFRSQPGRSPPQFPTPIPAQDASKSEPQFATFDEYAASTWGNK